MALVFPHRSLKQCWRGLHHQLSGIILLLNLDYVYVLAIMTYYQEEGGGPIWRVWIRLLDGRGLSPLQNFLNQFSTVSTTELFCLNTLAKYNHNILH
jgi:hypothetical protein